MRREFGACSKCGQEDPAVKHFATASCPWRLSSNEKISPLHRAEHFELTCSRCGYRWTEVVG